MAERMSAFDSFGYSSALVAGGTVRENQMESDGRANVFGANSTDSTLRKVLAAETFTHTDKVQPDSFSSSSSSALFGGNVLENFTLQPNFHRHQQPQRNKRKRKESSFSSCSSSSSASLLSLVPNAKRSPSTALTEGDVGEENSFVGGGSVEELCVQKESEKSFGLVKSADLNESSSCGSRPQDNNNRSAPKRDEEELGSPRRKRPKYDYTRDQMFQIFQPWVIRTYGDRAKTKTITLKKQARIARALRGLEMNNPDSSKFRFWVKTKGFTTTKPPNFQDIFVFRNQEENDGCMLYAPNSTESDTQPYKKVAIVENFFNIIYGVHVSLGSRSSRHAGQKRTYRTITETYAFLPREAVTKFLSLCGQCSRALRPLSPLKLDESMVVSSSQTSKTDESFDCLGGQAVCSPPPPSRSASQVRKICDENIDSVNEDACRKKGVFVDLTDAPESDEATGCNSPKVSENVTAAESAFSTKVQNSEAKAGKDSEEMLPSNDKSEEKVCPEKELSECFDTSENMRLNNILEDVNVVSDNDVSDSEAEQNDSRPITSTYLELTRSMGVTDDDALNMTTCNRNTLTCIHTLFGMAAKRKASAMMHSSKDSISMPFNSESTENNGTSGGTAAEDAYAGLIKDADKFKLMLLAWNYQNSAAGKSQNGSEGPDLATMTNLWQQYQNALAMNAKTSFNQLPITERQQPSPIEQQDETNSSEQKDDDDLSEDDSEDRIEATVNDPERLKAFNMFVRLFVDENLDRIIPISKQPKEKIQAIIDSCTRQFPEFAERARKRIRTYLKSCRRNKKTREGWENTSRPTPAHLTSVQAEQILALACENESLNAKRMRIGLEPISQSVSQTTAVSYMTSEPPNVPTLYQNMNLKCETESVPAVKTEPLTSVPKLSPVQTPTPDINQMKLNIPSASASSTPTIPTTVPTISNFHDYNTGFPNRSQHYQNFMNSANSSNSTSTTMTASGTAPTDLSMKRPILAHKLNSAEITAVKQLVTGYRESAAFLMRSADELENLLLQQQ
ncbi:uncharacterized protein LOC129773544 [Toxorhynchites rutilus septentrionalis]|uniref:uncharacterized protein LOC129773544 n=1 Tax=Toxorhynchites rutilus septentrionalis TaxID=329112 RepID=UPI00247ABAE0|nr:uncharacterized protein LOC129773544 [Toxorhynchites rutilus septentrionalis]